MQCNGKMIDQDIEEKSKVRVPEKECYACPTEVPNEISAQHCLGESFINKWKTGFSRAVVLKLGIGLVKIE